MLRYFYIDDYVPICLSTICCIKYIYIREVKLKCDCQKIGMLCQFIFCLKVENKFGLCMNLDT